MAGFREGRLAQKSHPAWRRLLQEVLVEDEQAGAWALPVSLPSIHLYAFFTLGPCFKFTFSEAPRTTEFPPPFHFSLIFICLLIYLASAPKRKLHEVRASEPVWFNVVSPAENNDRARASHRSP